MSTTPDMNKEREAFEAWYCDQMRAAGYNADEGIAQLREGNHYGKERVMLNGKWEGWQARASLAASAGSEPVAPYSIDADTLGIRSTVAEAITGALAFGAQGVNQPPEGHWLAPFWKAAREDKEAVRVKRDLRNELQQQCSTWGTYWRGSDAHGVVLSHPQAVELLQNALGVEVEIKIRGCQTCDYTGVIGDVPCPDYTHPSPPEGMAVTDAMIDAGKKMLHNSNGRGAREKVERIFNAMIAVANPSPPEGAAAEQALLRVLDVTRRYLPPDGPSAHDAMSEILAIVDPWPLGPLEK